MLKKNWFSAVTIILTIVNLTVTPVQAVVDPRLVPNNRYGIHILEPEDIRPAAKLVNSSGGQWGYVTVVLRLNDLNQDKWQQMFDEMRRRRLVPIVRLATVPQNSHWLKPLPEDADKFAGFLNSLNWVVRNRYVILFNEPNHAKEWGNDINPQEYAAAVKIFAAKLKAASADFFILPAGFDSAAPNSAETVAATEYWRQMFLADREIFHTFDGWNSHSYPNPDFSGPVTAAGLGSIRSYLAEVNHLSGYGLPQNLPWFITETGWRSRGTDLSRDFITAYQNIWTQPNLIAVTPFILNYPQPPFNQFSWLGSAHYQAVAALPKTAGSPEQIHAGELTGQPLPDEVVSSSDYRFFLEFINRGQSIWERGHFQLRISGSLPDNSVFTGHVPDTEPGQTARIEFNLKTPDDIGEIKLAAQLTYQGRPFTAAAEKIIRLVPPPTLTVIAKPLYRIPGSGDQHRLLIYNAENNLLRETWVDLPGFRSEPIKLYNLVPDRAYRLVILKPFYLPRQIWTVLGKGENEARFRALLPVDFNNDGRFSAADFWTWLLQPLNYFGFRLQPGD